MKQTHTKTPWAVIDFDNSPNCIVQKDNLVIADCCQFHYEKIQNKANARHIVKCVNSHDELVEACEEVLQAHIDLHLELADQENRSCGIRKVDYVIKAREALQKVKNYA